MNNDLYLIWSHEKAAWWGPGGNGYVRQISRAGRYTRDQALAICAEAVPGTSTKIGALPELPVRLDDVVEIADSYFEKYPKRQDNEPWL
jgi:hypothetical protein